MYFFFSFLIFISSFSLSFLLPLSLYFSPFLCLCIYIYISLPHSYSLFLFHCVSDSSSLSYSSFIYSLHSFFLFLLHILFSLFIVVFFSFSPSIACVLFWQCIHIIYMYIYSKLKFRHWAVNRQEDPNIINNSIKNLYFRVETVPYQISVDWVVWPCSKPATTPSRI